MKISQVKEILNAEILTGEDMQDEEVFSACGSDLMSDVLAFVKHQGLLLTGLNNLQVVRTADMMDIRAIVFVRGKVPDVFGMRQALQQRSCKIRRQLWQKM